VELHAGVDRNQLLDLLEGCGYPRHGTPVTHGSDREPQPLYLDNASYAFTSLSAGTAAHQEMAARNRAYHPQTI
jgi:hypothetical protein